MKVLLLSDISSPHTEKWALGLASRGIKVGLFSFSKASYEWYHHENITVFFEPPAPINAESTLTKLSYLKYVRILKKIIRHFEPDILHAHYATSYGLVGALSGFHPFLVSVWGSDVYDFPKRSKLHRRVLQFNIKKADIVLSTSEVMKKELAKYTEREVEVTPFGVDIDEFSKKDSDKLNDGLIHVGTIKSMQENYGISYIIEAAAIIKQEGKIDRFRFYLVGAGELDRYRALIIEKGLEKYFVITGRVSFSEVSRYHNMLDIFLNVSLDSESFGVATVEAMACEKPVIVTDLDGLTEVVNFGEFGTVIPQRDAAALAENILKIAADPAGAARQGKMAREHVLKNYNWKQNLDRMTTIYHTVAHAKHANT